MAGAAFLVVCLPGLAWSLGAARETSRPSPEKRALAYLEAQVPRWHRDNKCYSCHNNGDGARALFAAMRQGFHVHAGALTDTASWLVQPSRWSEPMPKGKFNDPSLARLQYAAALAQGLATGQIKDRKSLLAAARLVAADQRRDGSWAVEAEGSLGSPATYGSGLATYLGGKVLRQANPKRYQEALRRADAWFRKASVKNVYEAATVMLGLGRDLDSAARRQRAKCLAIIHKGQSRDGGWGPYVNASSEPFDTAIVLLALVPHRKTADIRLRVRRGRAYLVQTQRSDGSWPETTRPAERESYAQRISTSAWATLALLGTRDKAK